MNISGLIEQVVGAFRERDPDGRIKASPAWHDLEAADRDAAFEATVLQRSLESALDAEGLSSTAKAVLARIQSR